MVQPNPHRLRTIQCLNGREIAKRFSLSWLIAARSDCLRAEARNRCGGAVLPNSGRCWPLLRLTKPYRCQGLPHSRFTASMPVCGDVTLIPNRSTNVPAGVLRCGRERVIAHLRQHHRNAALDRSGDGESVILQDFAVGCRELRRDGSPTPSAARPYPVSA